MSHLAIGIGAGPFGAGLPDHEWICRYVERADTLGIDSIWLPDHAISKQPGLDTTVVLSAIAARTDSIKMGPSVLTLPARNPVVVANAYATLDYLTGGCGRVIMAVGLGADPRLCELLDIPPTERPERLREGVEILRRCWTQDDVEFAGEHYNLDGVTVAPKPAGGALDIWIGGNSEAALKRVAAYGDGWFPALLPPTTFAEKLDRLMEYCASAGRVVERDEAGVIIPTHVTDDDTAARQVRERYLAGRAGELSADKLATVTAIGPPADCIETLREYVDAGCTKFVLTPVGPVEERMAQIERYADEIIPAVG